MELDLSWNSMKGSWIAEICEILRDNTLLKSLNLSDNSIVNPAGEKYTFSNAVEARRLKDDLNIF